MNEVEKAKNLLLRYNTININQKVEVQLTNRGRDIYLHRDDWMNNKSSQSTPAKEIDGWFTCQLWELMQIFGQYIIMGTNIPFEPTIRFKEQ